MIISSWALWDQAASWALRTELSDLLCMRRILLLNKKTSMLTSQTETPRREEWWFRLPPLKRGDVLRRAMGASRVD